MSMMHMYVYVLGNAIPDIDMLLTDSRLESMARPPVHACAVESAERYLRRPCPRTIRRVAVEACSSVP